MTRPLALTLLLTATAPLSAAPITATYTFTGQPGTQVSTPVDSQPAGGTLTGITRGPGVIANAGMNSMNSRSWTTGAVPDLANDYYEFTITPDAGFGMDLTQLAFTERRSATGIRDIEVRTSLDAFAAAIFSAVVPDNEANRRQTVPLGPGFAGLTGPVTFRIYGFSAEGAAGTWRLGIDSGSAGSGLPQNLVLTGDISAVPEPASVTLLGLGVLSVLGVARRRNRV